MPERHALLIGVPGCDEDLLGPIPEAVVAADVTRMRDVLVDSDYEVTTLGVSPEPPGGERRIEHSSASWIKAEIKEACRRVPAGGTVLVYFSGHGVNLGGHDYLVPSDARQLSGDDDFDPDTLVPLDPARYLDRSRARLVVFVVDACRDNRESGFGGQALAATRANVAARPAEGAFVLITGCAPGQVCGYDDHGSYFTQTLGDILDKRHRARTVEEIFRHVQERMRRRSQRSEGPGQLPEMSVALSDASLDVPAGLPICSGEQVFEAWQEAIRESPLWQMCREEGGRPAGPASDRSSRVGRGLRTAVA